MGKRGFRGKSVKFYLTPEVEFILKTEMQKDGFSQRSPYLEFLLKQRPIMTRSAAIFAAWTKYASAKAEFERLIQTEPL